MKKTFLVALALVAVGLIFTGCESDSPIQPGGNAPVISVFNASPTTVVLPFLVSAAIPQVQLRWEVLDKEAQVRIDPVPGNVPTVGSVLLTIKEDTTFYLVAWNKFGTTQRSVSVVVKNQ